MRKTHTLIQVATALLGDPTGQHWASLAGTEHGDEGAILRVRALRSRSWR